MCYLKQRGVTQLFKPRCPPTDEDHKSGMSIQWNAMKQ